ncbi:TetR/AcrR family transcriptional regulator [Streptomyces sp. NBC_00536]|uniref:TetR/AcrR family transcriptional regulator n=1 Tax=Streptomyces sp. NBC_00536 TaxID=2975769 RepID=UPI002E8203EF|nr:TetR/AcrR family transcriptional regulator [Streptomyces sp. NBC_00536]WUC80441.1 TetR/AcrR family transcriptional regulator [Streptomyces sp. NBC_00536]
MGHREDLLEGAKKCLVEKGFGRTTARDIVNASGANLASIGYHYGSKDALLAQAFIALAEEWGDAFSPDVTGDGGSLDRFRSVWEGILSQQERFAPMWAASMEVALSRDRMPELRAMLAASEGEGRSGLISLFTGIPEEDLSADDLRTLGALYQAMLTGVMLQWQFDPATAATAADLTEGLRRLATALTPKP